MRTIPPDRIFKAFSDESRLRILNLLSHQELCVCDIVDTLQVPQSKVSRHLSYLRRAGLVESRRDEQWVYYALTRAKGPFHERLVDCLKDCVGASPVFKKDLSTVRELLKKEAACR